MRPKRSSAKRSGFSVRSTSAAAHHLGRGWPVVQHLLYHRVGFGVHAGHVQRVVAVANAQEAGRSARRFWGRARPRPAVALRFLKAPLASRQRTMAAGHLGQARHARQQRGGWRCSGPRPRRSRSPPPRRPALRASSLWLTSCWYWPTPMLLGSIFTSSASGSCKRRAMLTRAAQAHVDRSGSSLLAYSLALYTDAPASLTTTLVSALSGCQLGIA
jgi:hypothetical protein